MELLSPSSAPLLCSAPPQSATTSSAARDKQRHTNQPHHMAEAGGEGEVANIKVRLRVPSVPSVQSQVESIRAEMYGWPGARGDHVRTGPLPGGHY